MRQIASVIVAGLLLLPSVSVHADELTSAQRLAMQAALNAYVMGNSAKVQDYVPIINALHFPAQLTTDQPASSNALSTVQAGVQLASRS